MGNEDTKLQNPEIFFLCISKREGPGVCVNVLMQPQAEERHKDKSCVSVPAAPEATRVSKEKSVSCQGRVRKRQREGRCPVLPQELQEGGTPKPLHSPMIHQYFFSVIFCCEAKAV